MRQTSYRPASQDPFEAVWNADYDRAMASLYGATIPGASAMRSRVYLRMQLYERVLAELLSDRFEDLAVREAAEVAANAAGAYARLGRDVESARAAGRTRELARSANDPLLDVQLALAEAMTDIFCGRIDESEAKNLAAFDLLESLSRTETSVTYGFEANHLRARILDLRRMHAGRRDDPIEYERAILEAVACVRLVRRRDYWIEAGLLANLSVIVYQYDCVTARDLLRSRSPMIHWHSHLDRWGGHVQGALRMSDLLYTPEHRVVAPGSPKSPSLAWRVNRSVIELLHANWLGRDQYERELNFAIELAQQVDWDAESGDEFNCLMEFSMIVAPFDLELAVRFSEIYRTEFYRASRGLCAWSPHWQAADESFMDGCIAKAAGGDSARALTLLNAAFEYFCARGIAPRAAMMGIERYVLTRSQDDLAPARAFVRRYTDSPFARRLGKAIARAESGRSRFPFFEIFPNAQVGATEAAP